MPCKVRAIYYFIRKNGYTGKETILKAFCRKCRSQMNRIAAMRFETEPGHAYELHNQRRQVFRRLACRGAVRQHEDRRRRIQELIRSRSGQREILFLRKDALFVPRLCRAYRPQTNGKVEDLAKLTERLRPFNNEFEGQEDLERIVSDFANDINSEVSQATGMKPFSLYEKEKPLLRMLNLLLLAETYINRPIRRKVSGESMITFQGRKYSASPKYIGKTFAITSDGTKISICLGNELVASHAMAGRRMNYTKDDYAAIMKSGAFRDRPDGMIDAIVDKNLNMYDLIK